PRIAATVRLAARAWNAMAAVVANAGLWLPLLALTAWRQAESKRVLWPTLLLAVALEVGILVAAPMSEGRYGLFILITGQVSTLIACFEFCTRRFEARHAG